MDFFYIRSWVRSFFSKKRKEPIQRPAINVQNPEQFFEAFETLIKDFRPIFDSAKEKDSHLISGGKRVAAKGDDKSGFHFSKQFERPHEYLQSLLDMIRVHYEPHFIGTYFLNANIGFMDEHIPNEAFTLGYFSISSEHKKFEKAWQKEALPHLQNLGYQLDALEAGFVVVTTSESNLTQELIGETNTTLGSGFSAKDVLGMTVRSLAGDDSGPHKQFYAGHCVDDALGEKMRISAWLIMRSGQ